MPIQLQICATADGVARTAASEIAELIRRKPHAVLGLSSGATPVKTYSELIRANRDGLGFARLTTFNLDEYRGLEAGHCQSYRHFMNHIFFAHTDIRLWNTHIPNGVAVDPKCECRAFEAKIRACGGVDLWLLGMGRNGHIAFNEPGSSPDSRTRLVDLTEDTLATNSRFFAHLDDVPKQALTVGIATICDAKRILLLATGQSKARAIARAVQGPLHPDCPASFLQAHPDCTFILDSEAASGLNLSEISHRSRCATAD